MSSSGAVDLLEGLVNGDDMLVAAKERPRVSAAVADDAAYLTNRAEVAEDGVVGSDEGGGRVFHDGVADSNVNCHSALFMPNPLLPTSS
ncbi:hypothetical protein Fmac_008924 [Flemingia macrophylla]|uniref:Uncharacterized protein n=1 Tax=Flemingia macrophylla TaxID=520843 RepID=A0ABD1MYS2_9FABA